MDALAKFVLVIMAGAGLIFVIPILGVLFGAFSGWVVGLFFTDTILGFFRAFGVDTGSLTVSQIGAAMGFLGGFLKTSVSKSS